MDSELNLVVVVNTQDPRIGDAARSLVAHLQKEDGFRVTFIDDSSDWSAQDGHPEIAIVVGGDGSILRGCRQMGEQQIPIIGVNLGRLGFLADLSPEELLEGLSHLRAGDYHITEHLMFRCRHRRLDGSGYDDIGLNEICITAGGSLKMVDIALEIDSEHVTNFSCDGLIVSTPVGSTAHNLSAGGPILRQDLQALVITPICPHTLTVRPIIDSSERQYSMSIPDAPEGMMLSIDGQIHRHITAGDRIEVERAQQSFKLLRLPGHSYYGTLHRKLGWYGQLNYRERRGGDFDVGER